ncbi:hypothetical protein PVK06_027183 [Gossypium arboreum]|uniref:Uncharacterized protein n=1 Tax=Gossypium arboreum TaxID=29729 RepID=A0ABR0P0W3_GOSAR|nr:hypothetical protein PVK06_027183 [Gossypium arboreum]
MIPKPVMERRWRKPDQEVVKINFDANTTGRKMSFGLVARDHDGFVLGGKAVYRGFIVPVCIGFLVFQMQTVAGLCYEYSNDYYYCYS